MNNHQGTSTWLEDIMTEITGPFSYKIKLNDGLIISDRACKNRLSEQKKCRLACLLYHNLITIHTTATKSSLLLQNLISFFCSLQKWDTSLGTVKI